MDNKSMEVVDNGDEIIIDNPNEVRLSTGKVIKLRERKGQHHIIESRLLSSCAVTSSSAGVNIGDLILASEIKSAVSIEEIDGMRIKMPEKLGDVFELANRLTYDKWDEFKLAIQPKKELIEAAAKNLQTDTGLDNE